MRKTQRYQEIPTSFNIEEFKEFVFPNLPTEERCGPRRKLDWHTIVNYILLFLYMGCQWKTLPIEKDANGKPEIHYSNLHRAFVFLTERGVIAAIFVASVSRLQKAKLLDVSVIHDDRRQEGRRQSRVQRTQAHQGRQGRRLLRSQLQRDRSLHHRSGKPQRITAPAEGAAAGDRHGENDWDRPTQHDREP